MLAKNYLFLNPANLLTQIFTGENQKYKINKLFFWGNFKRQIYGPRQKNNKKFLNFNFLEFYRIFVQNFLIIEIFDVFIENFHFY